MPTTPPLDDLLEYLHRTRGFDFTGYKQSSLERRIRKRMDAVGIGDYGAYLDFLEVHPEEFPQLFNTILINVTSFFRDPEAWQFLQEKVLPPMLAEKGDDAPIRAWSAGCASGEEAYSIAMLLADLLGEEAVTRRVKIYATDVDEEALHHARQAAYTARELEGLPEERATKYFERNGSRYEFRKDLRRCVIFGRHDLIQDAPISRIDLLTCRNAIMYMNAETPAKILLRLHFALNDGGILMLGKAEMLLTHATLFSPVDLKRRLFTRVEREPSSDRVLPRLARASDESVSAVANHVRLRECAFDAGPVAELVVDLDGRLTLANARARDLFALSPRDLGRPLQDLEVSYRPVELRSVLEQAHAEARLVTLKDVERVRPGSEAAFYDVQVAPLSDREGAVHGAQISFVDVTHPKRLTQELRHANQELETAYEELQSTSEELETTNEELQSTVEELETTNEELQSTNEELETMNEELQSTNEELQTLNDELRQRGEELSNVNSFLGTILASLRSAVIVIDREMHVEIWNRVAEELWGLRADEVKGKNLLALDIGLPVEQLRTTLRACFAGETTRDLRLEAMNRRGKPIRCLVNCSRLVGEADARGTLIVIDCEAGPFPDA